MPTTRPATISELAAAVAETAVAPPGRESALHPRGGEPSQDWRGVHGGRLVQRPLCGGSSEGAGGGGAEAVGLDMERAFIEYARAATLIVETIPTHLDYQAGLSAEQNRNLKANGEDILEHLGKLKAALVERFEWYTRAGGSTVDAVLLFKAAAAMTRVRFPLLFILPHRYSLPSLGLVSVNPILTGPESA